MCIKNNYDFPTEKDLRNLNDEEIYELAINNLRKTISNNYSKVSGYLQELYAINAISNLIKDSKSSIINEWKRLEKALLEELLSNKKFKAVIDDGLYELLDSKDLVKNAESFRNIILGDSKFLSTLKEKDNQLALANEKIETRSAISSKINVLARFSNCLSFLMIYNSYGFNIDDFRVNSQGLLEDERINELRKEAFDSKRFFNEVNYYLSDDYYIDMKNSLLNEIENNLDRNRNILVTYAVFPEFITEEFNLLSLTDEQRDVARFIITSKDLFKEKSPEFKKGFNAVINDSYRSKCIKRYKLLKK